MSHLTEDEEHDGISPSWASEAAAVTHMVLVGIGAGCLLVIGIQALFGETAYCFGLKGCPSIVQAAVSGGKGTAGIPLWVLGLCVCVLAGALPFTKLLGWTPWISIAASAYAVRITVAQTVAGEYCPWTALPGILLLLSGVLSLFLRRDPPRPTAAFAFPSALSVVLIVSSLVGPGARTVRSSPLEAADRMVVTGLADPKLDVALLWGSPWNPETISILDGWHEKGKRSGKSLVFRFLPMTVYRQERITAALLKACVKKGVLPKGAFSGERQPSPVLDGLTDDLGITSARLLLEESKISTDQVVAVQLGLEKGKSYLIDCPPYEPCRIRADSE